MSGKLEELSRKISEIEINRDLHWRPLRNGCAIVTPISFTISASAIQFLSKHSLDLNNVPHSVAAMSPIQQYICAPFFVAYLVAGLCAVGGTVFGAVSQLALATSNVKHIYLKCRKAAYIHNNPEALPLNETLVRSSQSLATHQADILLRPTYCAPETEPQELLRAGIDSNSPTL